MSNFTTLPNNPSLAGCARLIRNVCFSKAGGGLYLDLLLPWGAEQEGNNQLYPAVVFLQGSGWTFPDRDYELPQLARLAQRGFVVATITHRNYHDGYPMPAFLADAKTAIRFLKHQAADYHIDKERISFWGTSSGGNTSLLIALTQDNPEYHTDEYAEENDQVCCSVACFPPTDLLTLLYQRKGEEDNIVALEKAVGDVSDEAARALLEAMSPLRLSAAGQQARVPILLAHGDADELVPYEQSALMFEQLRANGEEVSLVKVTDAPHEGDFWSPEIYRLIFDFLEQHT